MAVRALNVEANSCPLASVYWVVVVHVLDEVPSTLPVAVVVPAVDLQRRPEVVRGLLICGRGRGSGVVASVPHLQYTWSISCGFVHWKLCFGIRQRAWVSIPHPS